MATKVAAFGKAQVLPKLTRNPSGRPQRNAAAMVAGVKTGTFLAPTKNVGSWKGTMGR